MEDKKKEFYSFSKLSSFDQCPYGYKLHYIDGLSGEGNAFSEYGGFVHSILERCAKGELKLSELSDVYEWEYAGALEHDFPECSFADLSKSYYDGGKYFFEVFDGFDKYQILGVEEKFSVDIDDWVFNGIVDLMYIDEDGKKVIRDYKSKSKFANKAEVAKYAKQLFLYSVYFKQKYGEYPDYLEFYLYRKNQKVRVDFSEEKVQEALDWANDVVYRIRNCFDWYPACTLENHDEMEFYSENLCNHRSYCELKEF